MTLSGARVTIRPPRLFDYVLLLFCQMPSADLVIGMAHAHPVKNKFACQRAPASYEDITHGLWLLNNSGCQSSSFFCYPDFLWVFGRDSRYKVIFCCSRQRIKGEATPAHVQE